MHTKLQTDVLHKAVKLVRQKYKVYSQYMNVNHPAYIKAARMADIEIRAAKRNFEENWLTILRKIPSLFLHLKQKQVLDKSEPSEMMEEFNKYIASVFTKEDEHAYRSQRIYIVGTSWIY